MLIASSNFTSKQMNILIGLVVVMFIITAAYVGYYASQESTEEAEEHSIAIELETFGENSKSIPDLQKHGILKPVIISK